MGSDINFQNSDSKRRISALKGRLVLSEVVGKSVKLEQRGSALVGLCPFHAERTPSFCVNAYTYRCFGCGASGDIISWIMATRGWGFGQTVRYLADTSGLDLGEAELMPPMVSHTPYEASSIAAICDVLGRVLREVFKAAVPDGHALKYIGSRINGIPAKYLQVFGYAPNSWNTVPNWLAANGYSTDLGVEAGLLSQASAGGYYSRLRDRLVFAMLDGAGRVIGLSGRLIPRDDNKDAPKYLDPPKTKAFVKANHLWGLSLIDRPIKKLRIVEGVFDCVRSPDDCVAALTCHLSDQQFRFLETLGAELDVTMDGDRAGLEATVSIAKRRSCIAPGLIMRHTLLTDGQDPEVVFPNVRASIPTDWFFESRLMSKALTSPDFDRSYLDKISKVYTDDNIKQGWGHYNCVDWVAAAYPQFRDELRATYAKMLAGAQVQNGKKVPREEDVKKFVVAWLKPCREVRKAHGNKQQG